VTRALITGSRGFVGRHLTAHLAGAGDEVTGVDAECDVTNADVVRAAVRDAKPEVIYHLAAFTHVGESWSEPERTRRVNVEGTANVLAAARDTGDALVVVVSSADVYGVVGEAELPLTEDHAVAPVSPYARSKREAELLALEAAAGAGPRTVVVRPFNHVGPGQSAAFVVPALASRLLAARASGLDQIPVGDLSARRDFSDVRDVVRAYRLVAQRAAVGEIYNVASGRDVALADVASRLVEIIAPGTRLVVDPSLLRPVEVPVLRGSAEKLRAATGWTPEISWEESLADVVADLVARGPGGAKAPE
jgi:GDP-4-dehydro-6-deoxy-D-mannose reductase